MTERRLGVTVKDAVRFLGPFERHVVPNAGHLLPREAPASIVAAIKALIG